MKDTLEHLFVIAFVIFVWAVLWKWLMVVANA